MGNNKREKILHALIRTSVQKGYNETRISDITDCAGVGKGTFYLYFNSKDDCLMQTTDYISKYISNSFENFKMHSFEDMRLAAEKIYHTAWTNRHIGRVYAYDLLNKNPDLCKQFTHNNTTTYKELIRRARENDSEEVLEIKALMVMGLIDAVSFEVLHASSDDEDLNKERFVKAFIAAVNTEI